MNVLLHIPDTAKQADNTGFSKEFRSFSNKNSAFRIFPPLIHFAEYTSTRLEERGEMLAVKYSIAKVSRRVYSSGGVAPLSRHQMIRISA